ncbi:MAG: hypothetical protein RLZZ599_453 [Bacteroidota bacterium]
MQSKDPSMSRKSTEQKLAELALRIADYSNEEAANALLTISGEFRFLGLEAQMMLPYEKAADDLKSKLEARLRALEAEAKIAPEMPTPPSSQEEAPMAAPVVETRPEPEMAAEPETTAEPVVAVEEDLAPAAEAPEIPSIAMDFEEREDAPAPTAPTTPSPTTEKKSLNDRLAGGVLKFGLNDRIGFVKDLFDGSQEDFNRVVSQLNTLSTLDEANEFIQTHIAGEYRWEEKEETAARFMAAVEQKFG